jgi:hypothetical protein
MRTGEPRRILAVYSPYARRILAVAALEQPLSVISCPAATYLQATTRKHHARYSLVRPNSNLLWFQHLRGSDGPRQWPFARVSPDPPRMHSASGLPKRLGLTQPPARCGAVPSRSMCVRWWLSLTSDSAANQKQGKQCQQKSRRETNLPGENKLIAMCWAACLAPSV